MTTLARAKGHTWAFRCDAGLLPDALKGPVRKTLDGLRRHTTRKYHPLPPAAADDSKAKEAAEHWRKMTDIERVLAKCGLSRERVQQLAGGSK